MVAYELDCHELDHRVIGPPVNEFRRRLVAGLALLLGAPLLFPLYTRGLQLGLAPETLSATLTAHSVVREGDLDLNEYFEGRPIPPWMRYALPRNGDAILSVEPIASSLSFVPLLLLDRDVPQRYPRFYTVGNRAAARLSIASVVLMGGFLLSATSIPRALVATAVIAVATNHRATAASALWSNTSAVFWLAAGLWAWWSAQRRPWLLPAAGVALALAAACRPVLLPATALLLVDAVAGRSRRRAALATALAAAGVFGLVLIGNWSLYGSLLGGRAEVVRNIAYSHGVFSYLHFSPVHWAGLLISPSRGLFVYSPVLLFALPGLVHALGARRTRTLRLISAAGLLCFGAYGWIATWWGGWVFGPRYMTDLLPFFALWLALTPIPMRLRPAWAAAFAACLAWSLGVQQLGMQRYPCGWNQVPTDVDRDHSRLWDWRDSQLARCWAQREAAAIVPRGGQRR